VEDADARQGTAQAALPGRSIPGGVICSFYSYARPAGRYRCTWRVKVDDNTIAEAVFQGSIGSGSVTAKGTDFAKAGVYQEFSCTAEKAEGGFFTVTAAWPGKGRVQVDAVTVVSEHLFTEKEVIERAGGLDLPDQWVLPPPSPPRIHLGNGLWWRFFGLSEGMSELGGAFVTCSWHSRGQGGSVLRGFPASWQGLMAENLVVLSNVDAAALGTRGRMLLEEYVRHGGALFVLGGPFAFGPGGYEHTALDRLLPCTMEGADRLKAQKGFAMRPTEQASGILPADLAWQMAPRVYYYHPVEPRPGALVLAEADGHPMLAVWQVGQGRVAALAATAEGDPPADELAFWDWGDMPRLVAAVCRWLVSAPRDERVPEIGQADRDRLDQILMPGPGNEGEARERLLTGLLARCRDKRFAREILIAVSTADQSPDRPLVDAVVGAVQSFVDGDFAKDADGLIRSGDVGKAALGLRILGLCRPPQAGPRIRRFLEEGLGALGGAGGGDLLDGPLDAGPDRGIVGAERLRLAAVTALGDLGDPRMMDALRKAAGEFSGKRQAFAEINEQSDLNENIYQQSLASRCRLGDGTAVGPLLDAILKNAADIEQFQNALDVMLVNKDDKNLMQKRRLAGTQLPVLHRRQALCMEMLSRIPGSVAGDVARELIRRDEPDLPPYGYAALAPTDDRKYTAQTAAELLPLLRECPTAELRLLAFRIVSDAGDAELTRRAAWVLADLAGDRDAAVARFALRRAPQLAPGDRLRVIAAALRHPDPEVRRLGRLSLPLLPEAQRRGLEGQR
jgi:uncharacterized membrane protein